MTDATSQMQSQRDINVGGDLVQGNKVINNYNINLARSGLEALAELMRTPSVRDDVITFRNDFLEASRQIDILSDYKELHDLLHQLEFECYNLLAVVTPKFPEAEADDRNLIECQINLERIVGQMQAVAERQYVARPDVSWIPMLSPLPDELAEAMATRTRGGLEKVLRAMRRVLEVQPSQLNKRLNDTARALRLNALTQALATSRDKLLAQPDLDPAKVKLFQGGVDELTKISLALYLLVDDHDEWQFIQVELRRIESAMENGSQELSESFPYLKTRVEPLCVHRGDREAQALMKESGRLEEALHSQQLNRINQYLIGYSARASGLFYRVDVDLRRLCGELRKVGEPLASVLRMSV